MGYAKPPLANGLILWEVLINPRASKPRGHQEPKKILND